MESTRFEAVRSARAAGILCYVMAAGGCFGVPGLSAQLPGVPASAPPGNARSFEMRFANDFLGRGGAIDDFRTQQIALVARLSHRWDLVVDHSILTASTLADVAPARVDHLTMSAGRRLLGSEGGNGTRVHLGVGLRYSGEAAGSRMQNGFHQLVGSTLETMPYVGTDRVDGVLWATAPSTGAFRRADGTSVLGGGWDLGYWVRSATLVSTDGEWDGSVGGLAVFSRGWFQGWLGVRGDWRTGHDRDPVTRATADFEEGGAGVLGLRVGPLVLETAQGFDGEAAFGYLSLISNGGSRPPGPGAPATVGIEAGFTLPDVTARLQGRWWPGTGGDDPGWRRAVTLDARFGRPQYGTDVDRYVETWQLSAGLELERALLPGAPWLATFAGAGAGWRNERLEAFGGPDEGLTSGSVGSVALVGDLGIRVSTGAAGNRVGLVLQTGLSGWLPASTQTVDFSGDSERLLRPSLALTLGILARFRVGSEAAPSRTTPALPGAGEPEA